MQSSTYTAAQQSSLKRLIPDLVRSRELLLDLVSKELRVRYRIAAMGFFWAVLHPLLMMAVLTFVFGFVLREGLAIEPDPNDLPFHVIVLSGLIPWQFFAAGLSTATNSLVDNRELVKKVYFPREIVPFASVLDWMVNFLIGGVLLLLVHALSGGSFGTGMLWAAPIFAIEFTLILGLALILSSLNVFFRDIKYIIDVAVVFGFYATPVFYQLDTVRDSGLAEEQPWLVTAYLANPMAGLITAYRDVLQHHRVDEPLLLVWPAIAAAGFLALGAVIFRRNAPKLADHL